MAHPTPSSSGGFSSFIAAAAGLMVAASATASPCAQEAPPQGLMPAFVNVVDAMSNPSDPVGLNDVNVQGGHGGAPGALFADLTGDGFPEIYLMRGDPNGTGTNAENRLYLNLANESGVRMFVQAVNANANDTGDSIGAVAADYDNDGDLDLYVVNYNGPNTLLKNLLVEKGAMGDATQLEFIDVTAEAKVGFSTVETGMPDCPVAILDNSLGAAWADVNRDGWIDLYVISHNGALQTNQPFDCPGPGQRDTLFLNQGDGTFIDITEETGVTGFETIDGEATTPCGQWYASADAVTFRDINNDLWPDLVVMNLTHGDCDRDMLYLNLGADETGEWLGYDQISYDIGFGDESPRAMGVDLADIDNDGDFDMYITDTTFYKNDLWINQFVETGVPGFVHCDALPGVFSWGVQFADFNNDGWQDLHFASQGDDRDHLYMNTGAGFFEAATELGVGQALNSRGDHVADLDNDGWIDLLVVNRGGIGVSVYRNVFAAQAPNAASVSIRLLGDPDTPGPLRSTRDAIGARIDTLADLNGDGALDANERQAAEVVSGESNAAGMSSLKQIIGVGEASNATVRVKWLSGRTVVFNLPRSANVVIDERTVLTGDFDLTGAVNGADLATLLSAWGPCPVPGAPCIGDLNSDDVVNGADLATLLAAWTGEVAR